MTINLLIFSDQDRLGVVAAVDTSRVVIDVSDPILLTRIGIGSLVAIKGQTEVEYLISYVERVTRSIGDTLSEPDPDTNGISLTSAPTDSIRAVLIGTYRTVDGSHINTFKRGADSFPQIDRECFKIDGANLQRLMSILGSELPENERLRLGTFIADRNAIAVASGDKFFQRHAAILGSTGSGKSWVVSLLLERASKLSHPNIIVLDMHGEYEPLGNRSKKGYCERFRIAGPGDLGKDAPSALYVPYWLLNRDEMLSMILDRSDQNAPNQASRFTLHVRDLKGKTLTDTGKVEIGKTYTVDAPIPYDLSELIRALRDDNTRKNIGVGGKEIKGDWEDKLTRFISRLEAKVGDRRYGFMFSPPESAKEYGWLAAQMTRLMTAESGAGIKIIDFSEVPADVLPVVAGTLVRLIYDIQFWSAGGERSPIAFVCDEAHLYLPVKDDADSVQKQALGAFERIAKEGRKYGVALVVVSQRPADVSRTILSQCSNFLALRLTNETDQLVVKRLMPDALAGMVDVLPLLDVGEALVLGDAVLLPARIRLDRPEVTPNSATRDFWREWNGRAPAADRVDRAVECLRGQTRPA